MYEVVVLSLGEDRERTVTEAAKAGRLSRDHVDKRLSRNPAYLYFKKRDAADAVENAIVKCGGIAFSRKSRGPRED